MTQPPGQMEDRAHEGSAADASTKGAPGTDGAGQAPAMGLITPGPVVITATFIGYLAGGLAGAVVATVAIFTPIYLGVVIPDRWFVAAGILLHWGSHPF